MVKCFSPPLLCLLSWAKMSPRESWCWLFSLYHFFFFFFLPLVLRFRALCLRRSHSCLTGCDVVMRAWCEWLRQSSVILQVRLPCWRIQQTNEPDLQRQRTAIISKETSKKKKKAACFPCFAKLNNVHDMCLSHTRSILMEILRETCFCSLASVITNRGLQLQQRSSCHSLH